MQESNPITIVCVCDNHYAILLAALVKSIEANHATTEKLQFLIVEDGITKTNKARIANSTNPATTTLDWLKMSDCLPEDARLPVDNSSLPLNIYIRLFIPYFIPQNTKRVIFLDVDMIMLADISELWNIDIGDNIIGAVQDQFIQTVNRWGGISNHEDLGIAADNKYFNAGLMLIDIVKWENADITNKVLKCLADNKKHIMFQDQYGLNAVLAKRWFSLSPLWNRFANSEDERPYLIHFTGRKPIYKSYEFSEKYKTIFFQYLSMTGWKNFKPIGETSRYIKKFNNFLDKFKELISS